jgi:formate hydrogenlyase transcriptional activator
MTLKEAELDHIQRALEESNGVVGGKFGAAARLGIARTTLLSRMRSLGISRETAVSS